MKIVDGKIVEFLSRLRGLGVHLWVEDDKLRFQAPKGALSAELREQMAVRKGEIIAFLRQAASAVQAVAPVIERAPRDRPLPLSFAQQRLWFLSRLDPSSSAYNVPFVMAVEGLLEVATLARAMAEIVRRHEVLRTTLPEIDGEPRQVVGAEGLRALPVVDLGRLAEPRRTLLAQRHATAEIRRPFDLLRGPVFRAVLLRLAADRHVLVANFHHVVADGWSVGIVARELTALYGAFAAGRPSPLPELALQYGDFAAWQRRWLAGEVLAIQLGYWKERLLGAPAVVELPADRARPPVQSFRGHRLDVRVPAAASAGLESLAAEEQASPFMVLLAVFYLLLARSTGQDDAVVGTPIANRNREEIEGLIGFFVNTLALRLESLAGFSGRALVRKVREITLGAYAHQDLPFEKLVEELDPERDLARHPLFQAMFALQNTPGGALEIPGLAFRPMGAEDLTAKFDWNLSLWPSPQGFFGWLEVASDLFDRTTARRAARHYRTLAVALAQAPERAVLELPVLEPSERHQLLAEWNPEGDPRAELPTVMALFARQLERSPDAVAVVAGDAALSYRELAARSRHLALRLRERGVGPDVAVAISCERSLAMCVAVLGVLEAGAAYVPLDPAYPRERLDSMIENSRAPLVLDAATLRALDGRSETPLEPGAVGANLLYVIYTSGSTGRPKGVSLPQAALSNLILWHLDTLLCGVRMLQFASLSFDASFHEMLATWASGGTLVMITEELRHDPAALGRFLAAERVEKAILPVVLLQRLAELFPDRRALPLALREITATGEQLHVTPPVARFVAGLAGCRFHNHYGPSETHVVTAHTLDGAPERWPSHPPIGHPLPFCPCHVFDRRGALAAIGVVGELLLGGVQLARGYLHRPALTAEKFVPHPLAGRLGEPGARLYRTGDLARTRADGSFEYLGRIDHQVKIRGYRVELGEVEGALTRLAVVRQAVVVADRDRAGYHRLVAYVVPEPGAAPTAQQLREQLQTSLPDFMLPAAFVVLAELPLSANQKVDRKRLPAPEPSFEEGAGEAPRTPLEQGLAAIWCQVLGRERVAVGDSFFVLGGHSLLATQVSSRVREVFGVELPVRALFETPTLEGLARQLERALAAGRPAAPKIVAVPRDGELPLSFAQERMWFVEQLLPGTSINNLPTVVRLSGALDVAALTATLGEIVRRHEVLRTALVSEGGRPRQQIAPPAPFALPIVDLARLEPARGLAAAQRLSGRLALRPFDLTRGPLLRASLLRLAEGDHVLPFVMHHVASDGWSQGVLVRELGALYAAFNQRRPSPLPELAVQYADFALWQRAWLSGAVLAGELAYWREELRGLPPTLELLLDRPHRDTPGFAGGGVGVRIDPALTTRLRALAAGSGATLFMALLALLDAWLYRHSGQEDFAVGTPIAGRNRAEIEGLIGFFVNTQVLRATLSARTSFAELLAQVRERSLGAWVHQDLPFEKLVEELQPERSLGQAPFFQVMFALQNAPVGTLEIADLELVPFGGGGAEVRSDLGLNLTEIGEALSGQLTYKLELFDPTTAERLRRHLLALAAAVVAAPEHPLGELELLAAAERHQLLAEHNDWHAIDAVEHTVGAVLAEGFEALADRIALSSDNGCWSYAELFGRAHGLAGRLRRLGAGPERVVGVCLERSPEQVIALLGVALSGAVYLPLDPQLPAERIAFLLADAQQGPRLVISDAARRALLPQGVEVVEVGNDPANDDTPVADVYPESSLYVIYTSGSTGIPKGVVISHRAVATRLVWSRRHEAHPALAHLAKATVGFDVSVLDTLWPLGLGGRIVQVPPGGQWDVPQLLARIVRERVSHASFPPSMHTVLLEQPGLERLGSLATIYTAAEEIKSDLVVRILGRISAPLVNRYGPTETTIAALGARCVADDRGRAVPIGRPLGGARALVLDRALCPLPSGVLGELVLGGSGLARGYLGRPAITAAVFVPDPFGAPGERLYRSGDLARQRADGRVEYHGRIDRQVKVRGFRIELGEVEAALRRHPEVVEAVVVDRLEPSGLTQLVGWVVPAAGAVCTPRQLRGFVAEHLPEVMVPAAIGVLAELPRLPSGKVDRHALRRLQPQRSATETLPALPAAVAGELEPTLAAIWCEVLGRERVGVEESFFDLGGHSLLLVRVQSRLRETLGLEVPMIELFRYPTISALAGALRQQGLVPAPRAETARVVRREQPAGPAITGTAIAVVGLAGRFPGADDVEQLWLNLRQGVESITFWSQEELAAAGVPKAMLDNPAYVPAQGRLEDVDHFDAGLFGMSPREAELTDPQQRIFLECAFAALEDAGCDPDGFGRPIGVFGGVGINRYWANLLANPETMASVGFLAATLANDKDFLPTRVSYKLDLRGPSVNVQTACSTSLVAAHLACRSLLAGECDLALAGGVSATAGEISGYVFEPEGILSPDGHCRAYDAAALGTVGGQGVGIVVLKRLDDALAEGDRIRAVIRGSAINNDGSFKVGFTAPSVAGQALVIREALAAAGVEPATVGLIEGHGTATPLGDPIEVTALTEVFRALPPGSCALGSVKTNIGHVGAAAGVAGLVKAVLALEHGEIPPSLHFDQPNPRIDFAAGPFRVPTVAEPWPRGAEPRRAGVSSFGLGGTNAHVVLEEAPAREPSGPSRPWQLLVFSAASASALEAVTDRLAAQLENHPEQPLADVASTLQSGRRRLAHRRAVVCRDARDAAAVLAAREPRRLLGGVEERGARPVAFLFSGLGDHYPQMARELYDTEPTFRAELDRCAELLAPRLGLDLREVLFPGPAPAPAASTAGAGVDLKRLLGRAPAVEDPARARLDSTRIAQPAVFAVEWALAALLAEWGIVPEAMLGYSLGEFTAAAVAGVFRLEDALRVVAERAALIDELPPGAMLAVPLSEDELRPWLGEELSFAAQNGANVSVAAGPVAAIEELVRQLAEREIASQRLRTAHAFHSREMGRIAPRFAALLHGLELSAPRIPYLSNVTGTWIRPEQALDAKYWVRHLCGTVRFADGLGHLLAGSRALVEVGPGQALATSARQHEARGSETTIVTTLRDEREQSSDLAFLLGSLGRLWLAGVRPDWRGFARHERRLKVRLPGYPFERQRYFLEAAPPRPAAPPVDERRKDLADWFYVPSWRPAELPALPEPPAGAAHLVFVDTLGLGERLARRLERRGDAVVRIARGRGFARRGERVFEVDPCAGADYAALAAALRAEGAALGSIVHLWNVGDEPEPEDATAAERLLDLSFFSLAALAQTLGDLALEGADLDWMVVTSRAQAVVPGEPVVAEKAAVLGPCRAIPHELPGVRCRVVDVPVPSGDDEADDLLAELLIEELDARRYELATAYRGGARWVQRLEPVRLEHRERRPPRLRRQGCYLLLGGLGGLGLSFARHLATEWQARLIIVGRAELPAPAAWDAWLAAHPDDDPDSRRIRHLRELEVAGAEVLYAAADVADRERLAAVVAAGRARFGAIHGAIHAAGVGGAGMIQLKTRDEAMAVMRSKVLGARALVAVLAGLRPADEKPDFVVFTASFQAFLGGIGQSDYASANAFLDAFAHTRHGLGRITTLDWGLWRDVGMGAAYERDARFEPAHQRAHELGLDPEEGVEALRRALAASHPQLVITTRDPAATLERYRGWARPGAGAVAAQAAAHAAPPARPGHARPALATAFVAPRTETETRLAELWQQLLGVEGLGVDDNFFELGGDSLLATQLIARLRHTLRAELPLKAFYDLPTIGQLAGAIDGGAYRQEEMSEIERMLQEIKDLSPEEEAALLAELETETGTGNSSEGAP